VQVTLTQIVNYPGIVIIRIVQRSCRDVLYSTCPVRMQNTNYNTLTSF